MSRLHGRGSRVIRHTRDQNIRVLNSGDSFYRADRNAKPVQFPTLFDVQLHKRAKPPLIVDRRSQFLGLATDPTNGFAQRPSQAKPAGRKGYVFVRGRPIRDPFILRAAEAVACPLMHSCIPMSRMSAITQSKSQFPNRSKGTDTEKRKP